MKDAKNKRFVAVQKYNSVRQKQSQSVNDFVIYFEMLENNLDKFIVVQKKLFCLSFKKTLKKDFK